MALYSITTIDGTVERTFPLLPNQRVMIGSSPTDDVFLPNIGGLGYQCSLTLSKEGVLTLRRFDGGQPEELEAPAKIEFAHQRFVLARLPEPVHAAIKAVQPEERHPLPAVPKAEVASNAVPTKRAHHPILQVAACLPWVLVALVHFASVFYACQQGRNAVESFLLASITLCLPLIATIGWGVECIWHHGWFHWYALCFWIGSAFASPYFLLSLAVLIEGKLFRIFLWLVGIYLGLSLLWQGFVLSMALFKLTKAVYSSFAASIIWTVFVFIVFPMAVFSLITCYEFMWGRKPHNRDTALFTGALAFMITWMLLLDWVVGRKIIGGLADRNPQAAIEAEVFGAKNPWNTLKRTHKSQDLRE